MANNININNRFDLNHCVNWLDEIRPKNVCVYFLQEFHPYATRVIQNLQQTRPNIEFVVMVSCTSGPDTVSFRSQDDQPIDAVIYFGSKCLCQERYSKTLPTLFVAAFPDEEELKYVENCLADLECCKNDALLLCDLTNSMFLSKLKISHQVELGKFKKPTQTNWSFPDELSGLFASSSTAEDSKRNPYEFGKSLSEYDLIIFIGHCQDLEFILSCKNMLIINPYRKTCSKLDGAKLFRKRVSLIEKFKTQSKESIGIVFHDFRHPIASYLTETRQLCKKIKKIPYFITLNQFDYESRLGNFTQLTGFVFITSCACDYEISVQLTNYIYPVIFWKEFLIACKQNIIYGGIEWNQDMAQSDHGDNNNDDDDGDEEFDEKNMILIERNIFNQPSSWYGLVVDSGSTPITDIEEGRKGIASSYQNEQELF